MPSERYFTSFEPLSGDPSLLWEDCREPRLRRFPESIERLRLGAGEGSTRSQGRRQVLRSNCLPVRGGGHSDLDRIDSQVDFFPLAEFMIDRFNPTNWLGRGMLVDFSDIIPHHMGYRWWQPAYYAQQGLGSCRIPAERALEQRLLRPRPKRGPIQADLRQGQRGSFLPAPSRRVHDGDVIPAHSPPTEKPSCLWRPAYR